MSKSLGSTKPASTPAPPSPRPDAVDHAPPSVHVSRTAVEPSAPTASSARRSLGSGTPPAASRTSNSAMSKSLGSTKPASTPSQPPPPPDAVAHAPPSVHVSRTAVEPSAPTASSARRSLGSGAPAASAAPSTLHPSEQRSALSADLLHAASCSKVQADLAMVMDTTASMRGWLKQAKDKVIPVAEAVHLQLQAMKPKAEVAARAAFVSYKDFGDAGHLEKQNFTLEGSEIEKLLEKVSATGGGDTCEDVAGALAAAEALNWQSSNRVVVHFLDSPPHGRQYHDLGARGDHHMDVGPGLSETLRKLALNRISYTLVQCVKPGDPSLNKYVGECERVYTSAIDELRQRPGPLPKFTSLKIDHSKHEDFAEVLLTSTMRSVAGAVPLASKVFDAAHASGMAVIAKA